MASIITATTTSGLTQSADNSGVLQLASGTGNLVTVPSVTGTAMVSGNMPAFSAYQNADQSLSANTWTKLNFQVENFDTNSNFASNRFTPTVAGYYQLNLNCNMASVTGTHFMFLNIYKNGTTYVTGNVSQPVTATTYAKSTTSTLLYLNGSTDYVEGYAYFSNANTTASGSDAVQFSGSLVRSA